MRELEFRAWDRTNKVMVYNVNINDGHAVKQGYQWFNSENTVHTSEPEQYTGLLDKNGKKIFEGDLLAVKNSIDFIQEMELLGEVIMTPFGAYGITVKDVLKWEKYNVDPPTKEKQIYFINLIGKDYEITGNIHE